MIEIGQQLALNNDLLECRILYIEVINNLHKIMGVLLPLKLYKFAKNQLSHPKLSVICQKTEVWVRLMAVT